CSSTWNHSLRWASSVTAATLASTGSLFGGFDGPFVAVFPEAVYSPRLDDVHDRKRGKVHLRRRDRRAGLCAIPDHRRRTQGSSEPGACTGRTLHGRHFRRREGLNCRRAGDSARSARNITALGQAAVVAAL